MSEQPNFFAIIPASVRYSDICPNAKLLFGELTALTQREGYCWASNKYFAELYHADPTTISEWFRQLKEKGFVSIEIDQSAGNLRKIRIAIPLLVNTSSGKAEDPSSGKAEHNNTVGRNTKKEDKEGRFALSDVVERKSKNKATQDDLESFAIEEGMPKSDGTAMFLHFEEKAWAKVKDWKMTFRKWKAFGYLPSQKNGARLPANGKKRPEDDPNWQYKKYL